MVVLPQMDWIMSVIWTWSNQPNQGLTDLVHRVSQKRKLLYYRL